MLTHSSSPRNALWFPLQGPDSDVVVFSEIFLARNLATLPFLHRMTDAQRLELRRMVETAFQEQEETYRLIDAEQQSDALRAFHAFRGHFADTGATSIAVVDDASSSFVRFGVRDHLEISARAGGFDLHGPRQRCEHIDQLLEDRLEYAVSLQLGYLGPDLRRVGSGLTAAVYLHLSALEQSEAVEGVVQPGDGECTIDHIGGLYRISYAARAGEPEEETLSTLAGYANRLVHYEREARGNLLSHHSEAVAEAGHRALGTLLHARRLAASESAELINVLRFAVAAGLVDEVSLPLATELMMKSHDSQVAVLTDDDSSALDIRRARLMKDVYRSRAGTGV